MDIKQALGKIAEGRDLTGEEMRDVTRSSSSACAL